MLLGLFDSGSGGVNTVRYLKQTGDDSNLIYLIDRQNAPYGIKSEQEIIEITKNNIKTLTGMGAERVLIACCTASTVYHLLPKEQKSISIPIIDAVASEAKRLTRKGHIGVIATRHTVASHSFKKALIGYTVTELAQGELVELIDLGLSDETVTRQDEEMLEEMLLPILTSGIDTLILGCTHFPALSKTIAKISALYGDICIVDSAKTGADILRALNRK